MTYLSIYLYFIIYGYVGYFRNYGFIPSELKTSNYGCYTLHNKGFFRIILGREVEPHQLVQKNNFLNHLDEAFGYLCTHISRGLLFHLEGLRTPKESWEKLEDLFGKQDELQGHLLENELIALHHSNFETIETLFTK